MRDGEHRQGRATAVGSGCALTSRDSAAQAGSWQSPCPGSVLGVLPQDPCLMARICWRKRPKTSLLFSCSKARADQAALVQWTREAGELQLFIYSRVKPRHKIWLSLLPLLVLGLVTAH